MAPSHEQLNVQQRFAEKERVRSLDEQAVRSGAKSSARLKRESESFAFPKDRARVNLKSARSLI